MKFCTIPTIVFLLLSHLGLCQNFPSASPLHKTCTECVCYEVDTVSFGKMNYFKERCIIVVEEESGKPWKITIEYLDKGNKDVFTVIRSIYRVGCTSYEIKNKKVEKGDLYGGISYIAFCDEITTTRNSLGGLEVEQGEMNRVILWKVYNKPNSRYTFHKPRNKEWGGMCK